MAHGFNWLVLETRLLLQVLRIHEIHTNRLFTAYITLFIPMFPLEFRGEVNHAETRVMGLLNGESCMILTSTVFDRSTRVTDRRTDGR